jgi:hypothetical protein
LEAGPAIALKVDDVKQLFAAPEINPFSTNEAAIAGQAALVRVVYDLAPEVPIKKTIHLTLELPPDQVTSDTEREVRAAIDRYCTLKIRDNLNRIKLMQRNGWRSLWNGLLFLGLCVLLGSLFASDVLSWIPGFLRTVLSEGLTVIGWVALWHPVEAFLYDPIPLRRENGVYRRLQQMDIVVLPRPPYSSGAALAGTANKMTSSG